MDLYFNWPNIITIVLIIGIWRLFYIRYQKTRSHAQLNSLPGLFTSIGLFFTFWAIVASLNELGDEERIIVDNTGKTLAEVQAAGKQDLDIMKIISELIPAFTTSIIGLFAAFAATIYNKWIFANEEKEENERLGGISPEENIHDIAIYVKEMTSNRTVLDKHNELLENLIALHKEGKERNREYNDKLNYNISQQSGILKDFIESFVKRMDDIFKQMHGEIQKQVLNFGEEQFTKTSQLMASITERLGETSNEIIKKQQQSIEMMMGNTNAEINNITASVTEVLNNVTNEIQQSLSSLQSNQTEKLSTIISDYDALAATLSTQNADFATKVTEQMQNGYSEMQEHNAKSLQQMEEMRSGYQKTAADALASTIEMNENATAAIRESICDFATKFKEQMQKEYSEMQEHNASNLQRMEEMRSGYQKTAADALASTIEMNENATAAIRESICDFATKFKEQMQKEYLEMREHNANNLRKMEDMRFHYQKTTADTLANTIEMNENTAESIRESISGLVATLTEQMQKEHAEIQEHNAKNLLQIEEMNKTYKDATSDVLTSTLDMNEKATAAIRESIGCFVNDIHKSITAQCSSLSTAISDNVNSLNKAYEFIESLVAEICMNYDQAAQAYQDAVNVAHRTNESSEKAIVANNKSLQAVTETNTNISKVLNLLNERQDNIDKLTKQISSISNAIIELQKLESTLNKIANNK